LRTKSRTLPLDVIVACDLRDPNGGECEHSAIFKIEDHGHVHVGCGASEPGVEDLGLVYVGHGSSDPGAYDDVVPFESVGAFASDVVEDDSAGVEDWLDDVGEGDCSACELADAYNGRECDDGSIMAASAMTAAAANFVILFFMIILLISPLV